uniref:Ionotropic glutamate receptor C-terminal domain-containing protein n=2 Tax=Dendroctonus ponderosae TaxID=77166 RepID=A0AAR5Q1W9_DENPD
MLVALLFWVFLAGGAAPNPARVGVFFEGAQPLDGWDLPQLELASLQEPEADGLAAVNAFCAAAGEGFSAVLGPPLGRGAETLESLCARLQIPFIQTRWAPRRPPAAPTSFNVYPDADLLAQGLAALVASLDWEHFVLLYEGDLAMLQDVLKLQQFRPDSRKNSVMLRKLGAGPDHRALLKEVAAQNVRRVVLHCAPRKVRALLQQGMEVGLLSDFSTSVFLSDLDAHTLDFSHLEIERADLGVCDFTITQERSELIDFSLPIMSLGISILHKETEQEAIDNMYGFMRPFSINVWLHTITLYLVLSIAILLIARLDPDDWENPHPCNPRPDELENIWGFKNCLWLTLGSIMTQGCDILPKGICSRVATAMWWFFSLIMTSTYTANLAAFLTMSRKEEAIKSVEDLANQNKVKYGVMSNGSTQAFFQTSGNSLYQKMWATMKNENPTVFESTNAKGVERVLSTKKGLYAFFMESAQIEFELARHCGLKKIDQYLDSKSYGIGMPLGADYRRSINSAVLQLQENGKILELKAKWWKRGAVECAQGGAEGNKDELGLANVGGVFVVLAAGILLALLFAIGEFLWNVYSIAVQEQMGYLEALRSEAKFACNIGVTRKAAKPALSAPPSEQGDADGMERCILAGAGSVLNINASLLNRLGRQ